MTSKENNKTSESKEVAVMSDAAKAYLKKSEQEANESGSSSPTLPPFPRLLIVQENGVETEQGETIKFGDFHIEGTEIFGSSVSFRPLDSQLKIMKRAGESDNYKVLAESVYFKDWRSDERLDTQGTLSCGRVFGKAAKELSPSKFEANKKSATLYNHVFGIATIGSNDPVLVVLVLTGGKMVRWGDKSGSASIGSRTELATCSFDLTTVLPTKDPELEPADRKAARSTYVNLTVSDPHKGLAITPDVAEMGGEVYMFIIDHNEYVGKKYLEAFKKDSMVDVTPDYGDNEEEDSGEGGVIVDAEYDEVEDHLEQLQQG